MVYDIKEIGKAITYIENNNIGLITSYNGQRVVSSYIPFMVSQKKGRNHPLSLFCILKRKNRQWISFQYNDLILVNFGSDAFRNKTKRCDSPFISLQTYGKMRLIDDNELYEISSMINEQYKIEDREPNLERTIKECVGFEFVAREIYSILNPFYGTLKEFSNRGLFDLAVERVI